MATGFFALLDDIGAIMDDVALATKIASQKTAGILGDDLAVNAEKSTGFLSSRELPVLWAITKGSFINKAIIIPIVFLLNIYLPIAITIVLIIGGTYLAFEGAEKIATFIFHHKKSHHSETEQPLEEQDSEKREKTKIREAIRTDFILSLEIVIIALSTVLDKELWLRVATVSIVAIIATIGVYGIVALIVRMDDAGYRLIKKSGGKGIAGTTGRLLVKSLPVIVKLLSIVGTVALLMVAGGLFIHSFDSLHHYFEGIPEILSNIAVGLAVGLAAFLLWETGRYIFAKLIRK